MPVYNLKKLNESIMRIAEYITEEDVVNNRNVEPKAEKNDLLKREKIKSSSVKT